MSALRLLRHICLPSATRAMSASASSDASAASGAAVSVSAAAGAAAVVADDISVVYVTAPSEEVARRLATLLVQERRLAACVNIVPSVTSVYEWEGAVHHDSEILLMIKTRSSAVPELSAAVREAHPYDCPEVVAVPVTGGSEPYLRWVRDAVTPDAVKPDAMKPDTEQTDA